MRDAWTIAAKDLRRRLRDRTAVLVALVLPFGLAYIFSLTLGDIETQGLEATYAVVDRDEGGHLPTDFTALLEGLDFVSLRPARTQAQAESLATDGEIDAAVVFPSGFTERVQAGRGGELVVVTAPDAQIAGLVAESLAESGRTAVDLLLVALQEDHYLWARIGAARSLVEIAALTADAELRTKVIDTLIKVVEALSAAGIELIADNAKSDGGGRGVRFREPAATALRGSAAAPSRSKRGRALVRS